MKIPIRNDKDAWVTVIKASERLAKLDALDPNISRATILEAVHYLIAKARIEGIKGGE